MFSPSNEAVIVYNGEIYNFKALRAELEHSGVIFQTNSDTEVVIAGYDVWGENIVSKLRGMFAFAIYDMKRDDLFVARDHTGIKPFYYTRRDGIFVFASETGASFKVVT